MLVCRLSNAETALVIARAHVHLLVHVLIHVFVVVLVLAGDVRPVTRVRGGRGSDLKHTVLHPRRLLPVRLARPAKGKNPTCSPHETLLENMVTDWQWHIDEIQKQ